MPVSSRVILRTVRSVNTSGMDDTQLKTVRSFNPERRQRFSEMGYPNHIYYGYNLLKEKIDIPMVRTVSDGIVIKKSIVIIYAKVQI